VTVRLNILPATLEGLASDVVYYFPRDRAKGDELREVERSADVMRSLSWGDRIYVWSRPHRDVREVLDTSAAAQMMTSSLPAEVIAHAVREAAADLLTSDEHGFERLRSGFFDPVRLFRRRRNLAGGDSQLANAAGVYPYVTLQGIVLDHEPAQVGLVVDAGLVNRLDLPLHELAAGGIEIRGMKVAWEHAEPCACGCPAESGIAGTIVEAQLDGNVVNVEDRNGTRREIATACLAPRPRRDEVEKFYESLSGAQVTQKIAAAVSSFHDPREQWRLVEGARTLLETLPVFPATVAKVGAPLSADGSVQAVVTLPPLTDPQLNFRYGAAELTTKAPQGLTKFGPYDSRAMRASSVRALVICPEFLQQAGRRLQHALMNGVNRVQGFERRFQLQSFRVELRTFADDTVEGYRSAAAEATRADPSGATYDIVYVVTHRADKSALHRQNRYLAAKSVLANAGVASQAVTVETLQQPDSGFQWTLDQIALQCYAKLGNVAFALYDPDGKRELVLGVGRSDVQRSPGGTREQLFGAAVAFRQDGDFLFAGSTPVVTRDDYEERLTKLIRNFVERFSTAEGQPPERVVIHLFKRTGGREVRAVETALAEIGVDWALLHINRDTPLWLVEVDGTRVAPAPVGTVVRLGERDRLVMTGTERAGKTRNPHPLRLTLDRNSTFTDMDRLTWQVFAFTAVTMRSYFKTHEPSSILYGRLLAEKVGQLQPYGFQPDRAVAIGDKPWFL
jgi:hypothetical protein